MGKGFSTRTLLLLYVNWYEFISKKLSIIMLYKKSLHLDLRSNYMSDESDVTIPVSMVTSSVKNIYFREYKKPDHM
jgi:hypothetical protein